MSGKFRAILFSHTSASTKEFNFSTFHIISLILLIAAVMASVTAFGVIVVSEYLYSYRLDLLRQEKNEINKNLIELSTTMQDLQNRIGDLYAKDDELRTMIDLEPVDASLREVGTGGGIDIASNKSEFFFTEQELLTDISPVLDKLRMQIALQEESFGTIHDGIEEHKEWLRYYPGGRPLDGGKIRSDFGMRWDPFDKSKREMHYGIDLGGLPVGTAIIATADGRVIGVERRPSTTLGLYVKIEHKTDKYGWITRYGHMSKIERHIKVGSIVKRGEKIGELGNTGRSEAPHLHYEILALDPRTGKYVAIDPKLAHLNPSAY